MESEFLNFQKLSDANSNMAEWESSFYKCKISKTHV